MGSGSTKTHEAFTVEPAAPDSEPDDLDDLAGTTPDTSTPHAELAHTVDLIAGLADNTDAEHLYEDLAGLVNAAASQLEQAQLAEGEQLGWKAAIAIPAGDALASLDEDTLRALAAEQGFEHPLLVSTQALTYWLNPAYPPDLASKAKIQATATERYAQLAAGTLASVHGHSLAEVQAAEAATTTATGEWEATPAEVTLALAEVNQRLADLKAGAGDGGLTELVAAEARLHTAACPDMDPADLATAKAAATGLIDAELGATTSMKRRALIAAAADAAAAEGLLDEAQARWLDRDAQLALLRASTPDTVRSHLQQAAADRGVQVTALQTAIAAAKDAGGTMPAGPESIVAWASALGQARAAGEAIEAWSAHAADRPALQALKTTGAWGLGHHTTLRTKAWRAWAKAQSLPVLRDAAGELGLVDEKAATRAQVQNYIAAQWDSTHDAHDIQQQVTAKASDKAHPKTPGKASASKPPAAKKPSLAHAPGPTGTATSATGASGSWRSKHAAAVAALKAHQALAADVPAPRPDSDIAALTLSKGAPANVGGMHTKTLHTDEHGRSWLHKPDRTGGARAHAEAAAARLHHLAGVRTPPVYVRPVAGKPGSLQPWIAGGEQLPTDPAQWTQAEVDGLVRFHVAAWVCSNHDGNATNVLRTPSGGLAPIDHGQAWRYFGNDRLSLDYDPNSAYGNPPPAYLAAYKAAKAGTLAKGVRVRPEAALPAIAAFEAIPDTQLRAELEPVAAAGVKAGLPWVKRMRKAAGTRLGTTAVTDADVADEFCRQALARKQQLRADFTSFFSSLGLHAGALTKVA